MIPEIVRHIFLFSFDLTSDSLDGEKCFRCRFCNAWTADSEIIDICPQRNRRKNKRRSRGERRAYPDISMIVYAEVLGKIPIISGVTLSEFLEEKNV